MAFDPLSIGLTLAGGLLGAGGGGEKQTSERKMDPRMDAYVYGPDNQSGLLGGAFNLLQQQAGQGGLNDLQRQGLEMQRQFLMSPEYGQGYNQMRGLGQSLMGGGVAGNPFTGGIQSQAPASQGSGGFQYSGQMNAQLPTAQSQAAPRLSAPAPQQQMQGAPNTAGSTRGAFEDSFALPWDSMSDAQKAAWYSANPGAAGITEMLQGLLGSSAIGQLQGAVDPEGTYNRQAIVRGYVPSQGLGGLGGYSDSLRSLGEMGREQPARYYENDGSSY